MPRWPLDLLSFLFGWVDHLPSFITFEILQVFFAILIYIAITFLVMSRKRIKKTFKIIGITLLTYALLFWVFFGYSILFFLNLNETLRYSVGA